MTTKNDNEKLPVEESSETRKRSLDEDSNEVRSDGGKSSSVVKRPGTANNLATSSKVFIGNIPIQYCNETVIEKIMKRHGNIINCSIIRDKYYAFVEYTTINEANNAIQLLHGRLLAGRKLIVQPARERNDDATKKLIPINPKRQKKDIDSKIEAIKKKLQASSSKDDQKK